MMDTQLARQLQRLGRQQRNRIWFERIRHRVGPAGLYVATLLVAAAAVHQLLLPLNAVSIIGMVIIAALLYLCWLAIKQKPTPQQGAAAADQRFGANSLFVSAWEITRSKSDVQRVEKLLLERCARSLPDWIGSPAPARRTHLGPSTLIAFTLTLVGVFFLLQASHVQPPDDLQSDPDRQAAQAPTDTAMALGELLDEDAQWSAQSSAERTDSPPRTGSFATDEASRSASGERATEPAESRASSASDLSLAGKPSPGLKNSAAASSALDGENSTAAGVGDDAASAPNTDGIEATAYDQAKLINIETGGDQGSVASDVSSQGNVLLTSTTQPIASTRSTSDPSRQLPANGSSYQLSPMQRSLVSRYLAQLENIDDAKE